MLQVNQSFKADPEVAKWLTNADFRRALEGYDSFHGTNFAQGGLPRNPDAVLNILDNYLRLRIGEIVCHHITR